MKYSRTARGFHWITVVLVIVMMGVGVYMAGLPLSMEKIKIYNIHKSIGFCILILTVLRLFWRLQNPPPPLPETMKAWEISAAHGAHLALYGLLIAMPVVGMMHSWAANFPVVIFDLFTLPSLMAPDESLKGVLKLAHKIGAIAFAVLILVHALAALKHHWIEKDDVLRRMI
jgi:cytochrome b561